MAAGGCISTFTGDKAKNAHKVYLDCGDYSSGGNRLPYSVQHQILVFLEWFGGRANPGTTEIPGATAVMETFTLNLANGQASQINNVNGPPTPGLPTAVILDPAGANAYVIVHQNAELVPSVTGIAAFPIGSDGKLGAEPRRLSTTPSTEPRFYRWPWL